MQVRLMGIHRVKKRLADGSTRFYYYAWRGGPRMKAEPHTRAFFAEYTELTRTRPAQPGQANMAELVAQYVKSPEYEKLRPASKTSYDAAIAQIYADFFDLPIEALDERGARAVFIDWRDKFSATPRKADILIEVMRRILSHALYREQIARNPAAGIKPLANDTRREIIWTDKQIKRFMQSAPDYLCRALTLALWTGQRQSDLLALTWSSYDGRYIKLRQGKNRRHVKVPVGPTLKATLDQTPREAVTILTNSRGLPWTQGFRSSWRKAVAKAGIEGVTFHDLRGTFITLAYRTGSHLEDIAEITGHSKAECEQIIRSHYLQSGGETVIEKLETRTKIVNQAENCKPRKI